MRNDYAYTSMRDFENSVTEFLSANWLQTSKRDWLVVTDQDLQYKGVDLSCDNGLLVDCKIKNTTSLNKIFPLPSVEITIKHNEQLGWFAKRDSLTNTYFFISVFADADRYQDVTPDNITKLNVLSFPKKSMETYVNYFTNVPQLVEDAKTLNQYDDSMKYYDALGHYVFHLKYSYDGEGGVNLVMPRESFLKLPGAKEFEIKRK